MILRELFYYDQNTGEPKEDNRYEPEHDTSVVQKSDTRKTRLTLRQINRVRKAADAHNKEQIEDLAFIRQMYGLVPNQEAEAGI